MAGGFFHPCHKKDSNDTSLAEVAAAVDFDFMHPEASQFLRNSPPKNLLFLQGNKLSSFLKINYLTCRELDWGGGKPVHMPKLPNSYSVKSQSHRFIYCNVSIQSIGSFH